MQKLITLLFAILFLNGNAQTPDWHWGKCAGSSSNDGASAVITDSSGNVIVVGGFEGPGITFGTTVLNNLDISGYYGDIFIVKYDSAGNVLWAKSGNGNDQDWASSVKVDTHGNIFVAGSFKSDSITFGSVTLINTTITGFGNWDMYLVKYDPNGNLIWAKGAGGKADDYMQDLLIDVRGNIYVTGSFQDSTINIGPITINNYTTNGTSDIFIAKYDSLGNVLWAKSEGGNSSDGPCNITTDNSGKLYISGAFWSSSIVFGTTTLNSIVSGTFLVKYDTSGNVIWARAGTGNNYGGPSSTFTDGKGNTVMAGGFKSSLTFGTYTLTSIYKWDMFFVKYDSSGNVLWAFSAGGSDDDVALAITSDTSGNIYASGYFYSSSITFGSIVLTNPNPGSATYMATVKFNSAGNVIWAGREGTGAAINLNSFTVDKWQNVYAVGIFYDSTLVMGSSVLTNPYAGYSSDIFLAKMGGGINGIKEITNQNQLSVYPNPANEIIFIESKTEIGIINIYNSIGEIVLQTKSKSRQEKIEINKLPPGFYIVQTNAGNERIIKN